MRSARPGRTPVSAVAVLLIAVAGTLVPIGFLLSVSLMTRAETTSPVLLPAVPRWDNWAAALADGMLPGIGNSLIAAGIGTLGSLVIAIPASWAIVRTGAGGRMLEATVLAPWLLPPIVAIVPVFVLLRVLHLNNTLLGLGLLYALAGVPVAVLFLDGFVRRIPEEIEEAAQLDGASRPSVLARIVVPLAAPGIVAVAVIVFALNYNEFLLAAFITQSPVAQTFPVVLSQYGGEQVVHLGKVAAASLAGLVPVFLVAVLAQRWLVAGLTIGGSK